MANEIDVGLIKKFRSDGASDQEILDILVKDGGGTLNVNEDVLDLQAAIEAGVNSSDLLDFITSGKQIRVDINSGAEAAYAGAGTGLTNLIGLPVDILNSTQQAIEGGVRKGINYAAGTELSTNPEDYLFSSTKPFGGAESIRSGIEAVVNPVERAVGLPETKYVSREEVPDQYRGYYTAGRVVGENLAPTAIALKAAKSGIGLSNPMMQGIRNNPKAFLTGEAAATTGAASVAATAEVLDFGDNPYVMAGAEVLGALVGGNAPTIAKYSPASMAYQGVKSLGNQVMKGLSSDAARMGAYEQILKAADQGRTSLLKEAEVAAKNGDTELANSLRAEAELYTVERMRSDIEAALALGENTPEVVGRMSVGNLTTNPVLQSMQKEMMGQSPQFRQETMNTANEAISGILEVSELLARAGNTAAAQALRTRAYSSMIDATLANATGNVAEAMKAVMGSDKAAASVLAQKTLFNAKTNMREMETYLWGRIDGGQVVSGDAISEVIDKIYSDKLLDGMTIAGGGQIDEAINAMSQKIKSGKGLSVSEILKFRSIMLSNSRKAGASDDYFQAGLFDELAGAGIDELNKLEGAAGDAVDLARGFSVQLNKRFTRYFTKDALSTEKLGGTSIRDSELLEEGFNAGGDQANNKFQDLREASEFPDEVAPGVDAIRARDAADADAGSLPAPEGGPTGGRDVATNEGVIYPENTSYPTGQAGEGFTTDDGTVIFPPEGSQDGSRLDEMFNRPEGATYNRNNAEAPDEEFVLNEGGDPNQQALTTEADNTPISLGDDMSAAQEEFLRGKVRELAGIDNVITPEALTTFMENNQKLIAEFPNLRDDILSIHDAQRTADRLVEDLSLAANNEKLPEAIGQALATNTPIETFSKLAKEAITPDAKIDFRNATMDELFRGAVKSDGSPDILKISENLLKPVSGRQGDVNVLDVMVSNGILEASEMEAIVNLLSEGLVIEKSIRDPKIFDRAIAETPDIQKNIARLAGANAGVLFGSGNASLQAAAIGSAFFKKYIDQFPLGKQAVEMQNLLKQPKLLASMFSKNPALRKTAFQSAKEYSLMLKELGISGSVSAASSAAVNKVGESMSTMRTAYPSAVTGNTQDQTNPTVSIDDQMMDLNLVNAPTAYDVFGEGNPLIYDENGNAR